MKIQKLSWVLILGLFSLLFGCDNTEISRPDFSDSMSKVVHFSNGTQLTYDMPGNMSDMFNFSDRYKNESPRTFNYDFSDASGFKKDNWRIVKNIDGAMWAYIGPKNKGVGGEVGELKIDILVNEYSGEDFGSFVVDAYEDYLNGPEGVNTNIRNSEIGQDATDEELGSWIVSGPKALEKRKLNDIEYFYWAVENEQRGNTYAHYILDDHYFLSFSFNYKVRAGSDSEYEAQLGLVVEDIDKFMQRVSLSTDSNR